MDIEVTSGKFKSIEPPLRWEQIPPFAILTGENGGGKSQLLLALSETLSPTQTNRDPALAALNVRIEGFSCKPTEVFYSTNLSEQIGASVAGLGTLRDYFKRYTSESRQPNDVYFSELSTAIKQSLPVGLDSQESINFLLGLQDYSLLYGNPKQLAQSVANHFMTYWYSYVNFHLRGLSDDEILSNLGPPPWSEMNHLFSLLGLPYHVNNPTDLQVQQDFQLELFDNRIDSSLRLHHLSSGESTIVRLIMLMYANDKNRARPKIFLLDEPDSHLHASLIDVFISAIQNVLVERFECRVIMITHRVETFSFAPSDSIFKMTRKLPRISAVESGDRVIAILTRNLLHVSNKSVIVWVEDKDDEEFFSRCIGTLEKSKMWDAEFSPCFLAPTLGKSDSNKDRKGGRTVVRTWVTKLREAGLNNVYGLIDRDQSNSGSEEIRILKRYSIENYFCDPIFVFIHLKEIGFDYLSGTVRLP